MFSSLWRFEQGRFFYQPRYEVFLVVVVGGCLVGTKHNAIGNGATFFGRLPIDSYAARYNLYADVFGIGIGTNKETCSEYFGNDPVSVYIKRP